MVYLGPVSAIKKHSNWILIKGCNKFLFVSCESVATYTAPTQYLHSVQLWRSLEFFTWNLFINSHQFNGDPATTIADVQLDLVSPSKTHEYGTGKVFHDNKLGDDLFPKEEDIYGLLTVLELDGCSVA